MADAKTETAERTMDGLTFIAQMTGSLAWPIAAIIIAAIFRSQIAGLLSKVRKFTWGDKAVDFAEKLDKAEAVAATAETKVEALPMLPEIERLPDPQAEKSSEPHDRFEDLIAIAPAIAIMETWRTVDKSMWELAKRSGLKLDKKNPLSFANMLGEKKLISGQSYVILDELRKLRNAAAHNEPVTAADAYRFKRLADQVVTAMNETN